MSWVKRISLLGFASASAFAVARTAPKFLATNPTKADTSKKANMQAAQQSRIDFTGPLALLVNDHNNVKDLYRQFQGAATQREKNLIVHKIIKEVSIHSSAEEQYLYPLIRDRLTNGKMLAEGSYLDHQIAKEQLYFLEANMPKEDQQNSEVIHVYNRAVEKFMASLVEHIGDEEKSIFPHVQSELTPADLTKLEKDLKYAKEHAPTHPHPSAPFKHGASVLHPVTAVVDRGMDAVRPSKP